MKILGITTGTNCTAAVMVDGKIIACASEERFTRLKNDMGYPLKSIDYCLSCVPAQDIDLVAIATINMDPDRIVTKSAAGSFTIKDSVREQKEYWYPLLYEKVDKNYLEVFPDKIEYDMPPGNWDSIIYHGPQKYESYREFRRNAVADHTGIAKDKIMFFEHHRCHAMYALFASPFRNRDVLIFTADGFGEISNGSVNVYKNGEFGTIFSTTSCNIGRLYRYITLLLGMKPGEHEYKVMGLAPYALEPVLKGPYEVFKRSLKVTGLDFEYIERPPDMYFYYRDSLEGFRFDGIAGGLQKYVEELLSQWVLNGISETGIHNVVFSGGVSMNVKASMQISKLPEVADYFVAPSGGDESLAIGAAYTAYYDHCRSNGIHMDGVPVLEHVYLGPGYGDDEIEKALDHYNTRDKYKVTQGVDNETIAHLLGRGKVIGRLAGRMEFGARALGNRSILANPVDDRIVRIINDKIKNRDFWMPFAASILEEYADRYIVNPKGLKAPFMTVAFETTEEGRRSLEAALHPMDKTCRPQVVSRDANPDYHALIKTFGDLTGIYGVLNTSFNLHGFPIVDTPSDALHVFENSDLDALQMERYLIEKNI